MKTIHFTNGVGAGPAVPVRLEDHVTISILFGQLMPDEANPNRYVISVNGYGVDANYVLRDGDNVVFAESSGVPQTAQAPAPSNYGPRNITVSILDARGTGYGTPFTVSNGTAYEEFLRQRGIRAADAIVRIRNRGSQTSFNPVAGYALRDGDFITVTNRNISGA